jgi:hypothetical protein
MDDATPLQALAWFGQFGLAYELRSGVSVIWATSRAGDAQV